MFFRAGEGIRESFQWHSCDAGPGPALLPGIRTAPLHPGIRFCLWLLLLLGGFGVHHSSVWLRAWIPFRVGSGPALQRCFSALLLLPPFSCVLFARCHLDFSFSEANFTLKRSIPSGDYLGMCGAGRGGLSQECPGSGVRCETEHFSSCFL